VEVSQNKNNRSAQRLNDEVLAIRSKLKVRIVYRLWLLKNIDQLIFACS